MCVAKRSMKHEELHGLGVLEEGFRDLIAGNNSSSWIFHNDPVNDF